MEDYQQRVVQEEKELGEKCDKLAEFISTDKFQSVPSAEQQRLRKQLVPMVGYRAILRQRIEAFAPGFFANTIGG